MAADPILDYSETLAPAADADHMVVNGNLYLLFGTAASALTARHRAIVDAKVVPFVVRACGRFGPGSYNLHVYGAASASNKSGRNDDLAAARGYNAAMYAIGAFEALQRQDPSLAGIRIEPSVINVSDQYSSAEAQMLGLKPHQVERAQAAHRAAMFKFKARFEHGDGANVFAIREVYKFRLEPVSRPLPELLEAFKRKWSQLPPGIAAAAGGQVEKLVDKILGWATGSIPPQYKPLLWTFDYMRPRDILRCYELRDYRRQVATYRFDGEGHSVGVDVMKVFGVVMEMLAVISFIKRIQKLLGTAGELDNAGDELEKVLERLLDWLLGVAPYLEPVVRAGRQAHGALFPDFAASDWTRFTFKDNSPDWDIRRQSGLAKAYRTTLVGHETVTLMFGRPKSRNDWTFPAEVAIRRPWSLRNGLLGNESVTFGALALA